MFFDMEKYIYFEIHFASSNSSQFYFKFAILIRAEAHGSSLYVWDFSFSIPSRFY